MAADAAAMTDDQIREAVREILKANTHHGYAEEFQTPYCYIQPSTSTDPFQYFWDTCMHVFILTALDEHELAKENMRSLFAMQDEDGFVGHMLQWSRVRPAKWTDIFQSRPTRKLFRPHMSALIQPPLVARPKVANNHVFLNRDEEPLGERGVQKLLTKYCRLAGITKRITPHSIRHTFASFKAEAGVSPFQLKEWLGHARLDTTSIYVHIAKQNAKKVMEATSL